MKTTIEWISTDDRLPEPGQHIIALAPHMGLFGREDSLELIQCKVGKDGYKLFGADGELDWETDTLMHWALCPDWMSAPGWRKS